MRDHRAGVYQIISLIDNRQYVGSTIDFNNRWVCNHQSNLRRNKHHSRHLQNFYNKYGFENLAFEILEVVNILDDWDDEKIKQVLLEREQWWMDACKPDHLKAPAFNTSPKAGSCLGMKHTPEARAKIAAASTGRKHSPETRARMSANHPRLKPMLGRKHSPESIAKMVIVQTGHPVSPEARIKIGAAQKGKTISEEHRAAISAFQKGRPKSPETKAKMSAAQKGIPKPPEAVENMRKSRERRKAERQALLEETPPT